MAKLIKRLCLPVGSWHKEGEDKPQTEYRDIGVVIEFEGKDRNTWQEIKLNADILNPCLFQLARGMMDKGSSACRVKLFDVARKTKDKPSDGAPEDDLDDEKPPY